MQLKKHLEKLILTLCGLLILQIAFSQENYQPGFIITLKEDTLTGFIDYRNWDKNPDKIAFKKAINTEAITYKPIDIQSFHVLDEIYRSAIVETATSSLIFHNLEDNPELRIKIDTVFLQSLISGAKSLYYYKSKEIENFYTQQDRTFNLLGYKKYSKLEEGNRVIKENKQYIKQLALYLNDCPSIQTKFQDTKYNKKSLVGLFMLYYECTDSAIEFQKQTEKALFKAGILAGASLTALNFKSDAYPELAHTDYKSSINFSGGLFLDIILPRSQRKWSVYNELLFNSYSVNGIYNYFYHENSYAITYTEFGYSYLKINNMIRFKYPIQNSFIYINAGISNGFALSETNYKRNNITFYNFERIIESKALNGTRKYEQAFIMGLGTSLKKYSLEARYEIGNGMSYPDSLLNSKVRRLYILFGYTF